MREFRPLQEPIRLPDLLNSARSRAEKKIKLIMTHLFKIHAPYIKQIQSQTLFNFIEQNEPASLLILVKVTAYSLSLHCINSPLFLLTVDCNLIDDFLSTDITFFNTYGEQTERGVKISSGILLVFLHSAFFQCFYIK